MAVQTGRFTLYNAGTPLRLAYETAETNYADFSISSGGDLTIAPTGGDTNVTGNLDVSGSLTLGTNLPYSELNLGGNIVNADISASAEIAVSKLADGSARQLLQTDAAGAGVEWTSNVDVPGTLDVTGATALDSTLSVAGDANFDSGTLFVDESADRVGVGTTSPLSRLDVTGPSGTADLARLIINERFNSGATSHGIDFYRTYNTGGDDQLAGFFRSVRSGGDVNQGLVFGTGNRGSVSERMRITSSGLVGIGTASPNTLVEISASVDPVLRLNNSTTAVTGGADIGEIQFYTNDASSDGTGVKGFIKAIAGDMGANQGNSNLLFGAAAQNVGNASEVMQLSGVGGYLRMASGTGGIQFNGDTAAANALDDYEEGTWTPTYGGSVSDPTCTHDFQNGKYTKIGNIVHVSCGIGTDAASGGSGDLRINGLPFTSAADSWASSSNGVNYDFSSAVNPNAYISSSTNFIIFVTDDNTAGVTSVSVLQNGTNDNRLFFSITYTAA